MLDPLLQTMWPETSRPGRAVRYPCCELPANLALCPAHGRHRVTRAVYDQTPKEARHVLGTQVTQDATGCWILGFVATGGMAEVYLVRFNRNCPQPGVLKVAKTDPDEGRANKFAAAIRREARVAGQLARGGLGPGPVCGGTFADGRQWIVLSYAVGRSLRDLLREADTLDPKEAASLGAAAARALAAAHRLGVVHGDLSPGNLVQGPWKNVTVIDYGGGNTADPEQTQDCLNGTLYGTPAYLAPERVPRQGMEPPEPTSAGDVWSLGAILCRLLLGPPPSRTRAEPGPSPQSEQTPAPANFTSLPPALQLTLTQALDPRPEARPSAAELARQLEAFLDAPARRGVPDSLRRHLRLALAAVAALALSGTAIVMTTYLAAPAPAPAKAPASEAIETTAATRGGSAEHWSQAAASPPPEPRGNEAEQPAAPHEPDAAETMYGSFRAEPVASRSATTLRPRGAPPKHLGRPRHADDTLAPLPASLRRRPRRDRSFHILRQAPSDFGGPLRGDDRLFRPVSAQELRDREEAGGAGRIPRLLLGPASKGDRR